VVDVDRKDRKRNQLKGPVLARDTERQDKSKWWHNAVEANISLSNLRC